MAFRQPVRVRVCRGLCQAIRQAEFWAEDGLPGSWRTLTDFFGTDPVVEHGHKPQDIAGENELPKQLTKALLERRCRSFSLGGSKTFTDAILSIPRVEYDTETESKHSASLGSLAPIGSQKPFWPPRRRCHSLHSNYMLNRGYAYTTIISSKYHGQTLLSHLASLYPHSTPQAWQQKLNNGEVTLNGVTATGSESVTLGQTLVWNRPPWIEPDSPQHFEVLFEDPHLLAVNKPSGLPTLPGGGFMENTLLRLVQKQTPNANPVHRLGRATTGIVLFAKTPQAASNLFANWNTPKIQKIYRALAQNIAQHDAYEILTPIGLVPHPLIGSVWAANPSGKPSKSLAKVISRTTSTTTFEVSLNSGRPHQIRIHLASIGHPLVGDPLYGLTGQPLENLPGLPGDGGYFLHAQFLKFHHPITGEQINLEAALPSGFSLHQ